MNFEPEDDKEQRPPLKELFLYEFFRDDIQSGEPSSLFRVLVMWVVILLIVFTAVMLFITVLAYGGRMFN